MVKNIEIVIQIPNGTKKRQFHLLVNEVFNQFQFERSTSHKLSTPCNYSFIKRKYIITKCSVRGRKFSL